MNKEETNALHLLTGKASLQEVSVEELEQLANNHPYFAAAHLLLAKKMQQLHHPGLQQQLYKTSLHFPNEQWLRYLLSKEQIKTSDSESQVTTVDNKITENEDQVYSKPVVADEPELKIDQQEESIIETPEPEEETATIEREDENIVTQPVEEVLPHMPVVNNIQDEPEEIPLDEDELREQSEPLPIEESNQKIAQVLAEQAEAFQKPVADIQEVSIQSDPFHTVDYFASQGIKLEGKKEDDFNKKVHKFTDWLRKMKRINPHPVDLGTNSEEETYVANIAAFSNQSREIVTESMAEVLVKQDKGEKAVEIYQKLSLLYPDKSAYFAAKIEQLKR